MKGRSVSDRRLEFERRSEGGRLAAEMETAWQAYVEARRSWLTFLDKTERAL